MTPAVRGDAVLPPGAGAFSKTGTVMNVSQETSDQHADDRSAAVGANLRLSVACPKCSAAGWIKWSSLKRGIRCPKCNSEFLIAKNGQWLSLADLPRTRFSCPRCGRTGSVPSTSAVRRAECIDCKLPLVAGPDHRLHGAKEAAELHRVAMERQISDRNAPPRNTWFAGATPRKFVTVALAAALAAATALWGSFSGKTPEHVAQRFTQACLKGNWKQARNYLEDDAVQKSQFERWTTRHFASIIEDFRPQGDKPVVRVDVVRDDPPRRVFRVSMASPFLGTRRHEQIWVLRNGHWYFDVQASLGDPLGIQPGAGPHRSTPYVGAYEGRAPSAMIEVSSQLPK